MTIFLRVVEQVLRERAAVAAPKARLGAVSFVHRFRSALNEHLRFHCCLIDGVFEPGQKHNEVVTYITVRFPYQRDIGLPVHICLRLIADNKTWPGSRKIQPLVVCPRALTVQTFFHGPLHTRRIRDFEHNRVGNRECRGPGPDGSAATHPIGLFPGRIQGFSRAFSICIALKCRLR